ncbi:MAG: TusE/DsrC/DsvC family sulfur relay protein [Pseudomonadales bacterium]|nr:TusE/DsrC/DsvC family sulfur relay protein [Pseudomonadales bacterium]NIX07768.1 TusE/DsrC/DsvC family sulfur relay protein [Pseudomonadales bacterium]
MSTAELAGTQVELDAEGFMVDHERWTREIAEELAREEGIELTPRHFEVLEFMRKDYAEKGTAPTIRRLKKLNVVPTKELYALFPGGPAKKASKIAGLPKPKGCV